jgi:hypothetical protein
MTSDRVSGLPMKRSKHHRTVLVIAGAAVAGIMLAAGLATGTLTRIGPAGTWSGTTACNNLVQAADGSLTCLDP